MRSAAIVIVLSILAGCRSPTQIEVTVTTDLTCDHVGDTAITVGRLVDLEPAPPATTSTRCVDGRLGALVIVPSGDEDAAIAFRVVSAINGQRVDDCTAPAYGPSCITYAGSCAQPVVDAAGDVYAACTGTLVKLDSTLHLKWAVAYPWFDGTGVVAADSPILGQGGRIFVALGNQNPGPDGGPPDEILGFAP
jgi:hypothetical protein